MADATSPGPALFVTNLPFRTGSANSAPASIDTAASAMHKALTIQ